MTETTSRSRRGPRPDRRPRPALNALALERLALHYVGKYATSRGRLVDYLTRKLRERDWEGEVAPDLPGLADRFVELGYVDDKAFAEGRARSLGGRGYGKARVRQALHAAGIDQNDAGGAHLIADDGRWAAALRHAERKRIGPWARELPDRNGLQKAIASLIRAGHDFATAKLVASAMPGVVPDEFPS